MAEFTGEAVGVGVVDVEPPSCFSLSVKLANRDAVKEGLEEGDFSAAGVGCLSGDDDVDDFGLFF